MDLWNGKWCDGSRCQLRRTRVAIQRLFQAIGQLVRQAEDQVHRQRRDPYPAIYFLSGLTCTWENATVKAAYAKAAKKSDVVMIFPDTSPRGIDEACPDAGKEMSCGYGAGHYCNAT